MDRLQNDQDESIYSAAIACSKLFNNLCLKSLETNELRCDVAEELCGRFNLWAAYVGALASPKASLDARLVDHSDVKDMILELLAMVKRNILHGRHTSILYCKVES